MIYKWQQRLNFDISERVCVWVCVVKFGNAVHIDYQVVAGWQLL